MQYTESIVNCRKEKEQDHPTTVDWQTTFEPVNDPRRKQGTRFRLASMLLLALAAMLSNHVSELAIAQWGTAQSDKMKKALGCAERRHAAPKHHSPSLSPLECG